MRFKKATTNLKNIDDRWFQYAFALTKYHEERKNHPEHELNIKPFLDLCNWAGIEYPADINKNNYTLFKESNPKIVLIMLYIDLNPEILNWIKDYMLLYINQSNNHMYLIVTMKEKKGSFVINFPCYTNQRKTMSRNEWESKFL